ncbi:hypothetical protein JYU15_01420 [bacterium AH-315-I18]|nr:hypothetical protein [Phycisphaeraceae bacterium]MBN4061073.1 hypothetical protein [bacterium AH-315-I18]
MSSSFTLNISPVSDVSRKGRIVNLNFPDLWHKSTSFLDHYRSFILSLIFTGLLAGYLLGCEVKTPSLIDPAQLVSAAQLQSEAHKLQAQYTQREKQLQLQLETLTLEQQDFNTGLITAVNDLETKTQQRQQIIDTLGGLAVQAAQGTANPISALTALIGLVSAGSAVGLGLDSLRKDRVIKNLKKKSDNAAVT